MSNKVSVELGVNVAGYKQGMKDAKDSTAQYNTETKKVKDQLSSFTGEMRKAKKEVQDLALAYSKLSNEERKSQFGIEMKKQLDAAKKSAADFVDIQGDLQQELKNLASDTKAFDMMADGIGTVANIASGALGAFAMLTGEEEDAQRALVAFTTAQSVLASVTKIQNALQMQSNTMLAVTKVQNLAAAAAINVRSAAEGKGVIATKAATVAQALFNKVAYANPYVILALAVTGVVTALGAFMIYSKKAREEEERMQKETERLKTYNDALNNELKNTIPTLYKLQAEWNNLRTEAEKKKWIQENQTEFNKLGIEVNSVVDAENVLVRNTGAVVQALMLRAKAAAQQALAQKKYEESLARIDKLKAARGKKDLNPNDVADLGLSTNSKNVKHESRGWISELYSVDVDKEIALEMQKADAELKKGMEDMVKTQNEGYKKLKENGIKAASSASKAVTKAHKTGSKDTQKQIAKNSVEEAEAYLKAWKEKLSKVDINNDVAIKTINTNIDKWQKELNRRKLQVGIEVKAEQTKTMSDILSDYEKKLKTTEEEAEAAMILAQLHNKDANEIERLTEEWEKAKKAREDYEGVKKSMTEGVTVTGDKNYGPAKSGNFEKSVNGYNTAITSLQEKLNTLDLTNGGSEAAALWEELTSLLAKYKEQLQEIQELQEEATQTGQEKAIKQAQKAAAKYENVADAVGTIGDAFSSLAKIAEDNPALDIMGIVAQAVANVLLGYAQATVAASQTGNPFVWMAFAIAGLATTLAAVASIKSAAEAHAQGGLVGGSSYSGDNVLTRLNSGEMVLNKHQQQNLFNAINSGNLGSNGGPQTVQVQGVIRGTDILLVSKNTNKALSRSGHNINI